MILDFSSNGGHIRLGSLAILWQNQDSEFPGFTVISCGDFSLELGDIDNGNGVFITKYKDGDIEYSRPLLQF